MTSRALRRSAVLPLVLAATLALSACGSDDIDTVGGAAQSAPDTSAGSPAADSPAASTGKGALPKVTANETDLTKEPVAAAGTGAEPTTLQTRDLVVGKGTAATSSATVTIMYTGSLYSDGSVFDDSPWKSGQPAVFPLNRVVPGFAQGIVGMKIGGRRLIVIPSDLAYGPDPDPRSGIPPNAALVFIVDLRELS